MSQDLDDAWELPDQATYNDPLLDSLVIMTQLYGTPWTAEALRAGLPLVRNRLTPSLLPRAASRAHLTARVVRQPLRQISSKLMPNILLLRGRRACVLLGRLPGGYYRIRFPEAGGESSVKMSAADLDKLYSGMACFVQPTFRFEERAPQIRSLQGQHWFWGTVLENWRLYRDALLAALILNLFALATPLFSMNVYDRVVPNRAVETLWVLAIGALLILGFDLGLRTIRAYIIDAASKRIDINLSARIMERVLGVRMDARPPSVGSFAANLRSFESVRDFIASATITTLVDLPFAILFLGVLIWISPILAVPPLVGFLVLMFVSFVTQAKMQELTESSARAATQRNATLIESLVGLETIKTLCAEGLIQRRYERATQFIAQASSKLKLLSSGTVNFSQFTQQAVSIAVVIVGVYELVEGKISMGAIVGGSMLAGRALGPLAQVAGLLMQYQNAKTSLGAINRQMELPVERPENAPFLHRDRFEGQIEFKNVSFMYPGRKHPALKNVSFSVKAGGKVGILGRIGSGKTTIEKLILGLYQPTEGSVLIDGVDARQIDPAELRKAIGFVPQDVTLFYGTLKENIEIGTAFASDAAILEAAEVSGVSEFANNHPQGFDMLIGERGESLSGGQRQAVAISRAILNDPPILLLDEPTASMDHQSEDRIKQRLKTLSQHKTVVLITHRMSLLEMVDRIIVLDQGRVVADGPKQQVIEALQQGRIAQAR